MPEKYSSSYLDPEALPSTVVSSIHTFPAESNTNIDQALQLSAISETRYKSDLVTTQGSLDPYSIVRPKRIVIRAKKNGNI